ncbi:leucine-rich repeat domain-containing protein [Butyrivibrio sp. AE2032]|uniref:leucine-rich repeat domain-containing protein n=1 Tax=Butyrivibrio sp. AE2032 TaxID=1458463 RepID=UPI00054EFDE0|nr:leucine-rich repeat domain-containing protein [Butyrivibrio sp. AE2032]
MKKKVISVLLALAMGVSLVGCSQENGSSKHNDGEPDRETEVVDLKANEDYFTFRDSKSGLKLTGLTDKGKKQESLVIPSGVIISCTLKEGIVKNVYFESDDDIDLKLLLSGSDTIETIKLPANLTELTAIDSCHSLKEITIPKGVTEIPKLCFYSDISLETVVFQGDITVIDDNAFKQCESLENICIPDSVTTIGNMAFYGCKSLKTITLPKGLKVIGNSAFQNDEDGIKTIIVPEELELEKWDKEAFDQFESEYTVKVVKGSWADNHFDEVFSGNAIKKFA